MADLLNGKVALVTGSSRGIGAAIARLFARNGARVALHGRDSQALAAVQRDIESEVGAGNAISTFGDTTRVEDIERVRRATEEAFGPVDILVANAGSNTVCPGPVEEMSDTDWRSVVDANLTATFLTLKSFLPGMKARKRGVVITVSSAAARRPSSHSPVAYAAAKAGIELLTRDVALQAGPFGVRANCIAPETILTERNLQQIPEPLQRTLAEQHPVGRLGTPEDVAEAALFLASDQSAWISGVVLDVAGGSVLV
ncbi:MAG TPA: SDR family NAD(P)-dependent oxidoreductase [Gemmatimonadaceae bacterium]